VALTAVDTNVVVRLLTGDETKQFEDAKRCFASGEIFVPDSVLLETVWVLAAAYSFSREQIATALRQLLGLANVQVEDAARMPLPWSGTSASSTSLMRSIWPAASRLTSSRPSTGAWSSAAVASARVPSLTQPARRRPAARRRTHHFVAAMKGIIGSAAAMAAPRDT